MKLFVITDDQKIGSMTPDVFISKVDDGSVLEGIDFHVSVTEPKEEFIARFSESKGCSIVYVFSLAVTLPSSKEDVNLSITQEPPTPSRH